MHMNICRTRIWLSIVVLLLASTPLTVRLEADTTYSVQAAAQQKLLTIDDIYDSATRVKFSGNPATGLVWTDASHYAWARAAGSGVDWMSVDAAGGGAQPLFDAAKMEAAVARLPGVSVDEARRLAHSRDLVFNDQYSAALMTIASDLYVYTFANDRAVRLTYGAGEEELPTFSPDGALVAFVRDNNLFVVDVGMRRESALTSDGTAKILNGKLDWVYEEEIYGRGRKQAYWWSPDSSRIAFLQIDDRPVHTYVTVDDIPYEPTVERWDYPRAGDPNPIAKLAVARATGGAPQWIDTSRYSAADHLLVSVGWTPDAKHVVYEVENRTQTWLDLDVADAESGTPRTLLRETSKYWIASDETSQPVWLKDGSFLWQSTRSGWRHLYHYKPDGALIRQVTSGTWEMRTLHGVDEATGWVYFSGTEHSHIGGDVYRVKLDGSGFQRLSKTEGTHNARFNPALSMYIDSWSDAVTPTQVRLHRSDGSELRAIDENKVAALAQYRLSRPEFLQVKTRDGFLMEAEMIKPPDFNPSRRYPVYQFTYAGPHAPQVHNAWGGSQYMYHQLLAQKGVIVWICDNRSASGKGIESAWPVYKHLGELELRDIEDGVSWLKQQPYVDASRIGIHGWSGGGFMTTYALTHSTSFVMGIAGGTLADLRDYDSVWTERYMDLPQENPDGYRNSSPRWAAKDLHGALLLIHGAIDDNVHVQNTMQLAHELQKAQKPFRLMLYPKSRHGISDPALVKHLRTMMLDFTLEHLKPGDPGTASR
jgi:dipeptidyl-peptidase-4